jgi:hypothetical protein
VILLARAVFLGTGALQGRRQRPLPDHFLSIDAHRARRADAQANPFASDGSHDNLDVLANHDLFADTPSEH